MEGLGESRKHSYRPYEFAYTCRGVLETWGVLKHKAFPIREIIWSCSFHSINITTNTVRLSNEHIVSPVFQAPWMAKEARYYCTRKQQLCPASWACQDEKTSALPRDCCSLPHWHNYRLIFCASLQSPPPHTQSPELPKSVTPIVCI